MAGQDDVLGAAGAGMPPGGGPLDRLVTAIEAQVAETRRNTKAFTEINGKLEAVQHATNGLKDALTNGGFKKLETALCGELDESQERLVTEMKTLAIESTGKVIEAIQSSGPRTMIALPKIGWVAVVLFLLFLLVAFGVRIPELVSFFKGTGG